MTLLDLTSINTAIVLSIGGLVVHWIRRVNKSFRDVECLRFDLSLKIVALEAAMAEHEGVSEQVHVDIARRLERLEGWPHERGN